MTDKKVSNVSIKFVLSLLISAIIVGAWIIGLFHINNKQIRDGVTNPPSRSYVEEDMEIYLFTTGLGCDDYVLGEDDFNNYYAIYFIQRLGEERYYFVAYKFDKPSKRYKYSHYVEVNKEEYFEELECKCF